MLKLSHSKRQVLFFIFDIKSVDNIVIIYIIRITTDFIVCGIAPFKDMMLLLAYTNADMHQHEETDDPEKQKRQVIMRNLY